MPLNPAPLEDALRFILDTPPPNAALSAQRFAKAYADYAAGAVAGSYGPVVLTGTERPRLEALLRAALTAPVGAAPVLATAWATGLQLFWTGAVFGPAAATAVAGVPAVIGGLTALYLNLASTKAAAAAGTATVLDVATRTVIVVGPSGPQPVT